LKGLLFYHIKLFKIFCGIFAVSHLNKKYFMAAIDTPTNRHQSGKRMVKKSTKVDLTPMVDLGFLLITFFVFTTTMSKPTAMKVEMPFDKTTVTDGIFSSCVLTAVLCDNDGIRYYEGSIDTAVIVTTDYKSIREIIQQKRRKVFDATGNKDRFVLIIKPSGQSSFKNFVDMTDEVTINQIKRYYIDELNDEEKIKLHTE
jgi:biopolymer transport protein ExbD